jgi:tryptophan synthase beta chain
MWPDAGGRFGPYGGQFVPETLMAALRQLDEAYKTAKVDPAFWGELERYLTDYVGRPSPLYHAAQLSHDLGGPAIYLKREDLNHTGAHKINNTLGQALLARRMGKTRLIAETGRGSMASPRPRRWRRCSVLIASSIWARRTCAAKSSTSFE